MYLIYLDESGTPSSTDPDEYYSLGGLVICERDWKTIDNDVELIKKKYNIKEIHIRRMFNKNKQRIIRSINSGSLSQSAIIMGETYNLIARSNLILLCVTIDKKVQYNKKFPPDIELTAWKYLIERLNICVHKLCKLSGVDEYGLIIMDEKDDVKDLRTRNHFKSVKENTVHSFQIIDRIIEDPVFSPSHWRNLTQLADAVVTCSKYYIKQESFFITQFLTIQDRFDKDKYGNIENAGFKIW